MQMQLPHKTMARALPHTHFVLEAILGTALHVQLSHVRTTLPTHRMPCRDGAGGWHVIGWPLSEVSRRCTDKLAHSWRWLPTWVAP